MTPTAPWLNYSSSDWLAYAKSLPTVTGKQQRFRTFCLRCAAALHFRKDPRLMLWSPGSVLMIYPQRPKALTADVFVMRGADNPSPVGDSSSLWARGLRWVGANATRTILSKRNAYPYDSRSLIWLGHHHGNRGGPTRGEFLLGQLSLADLLSSPTDFSWMHPSHPLTRSWWSVLIQGYHVAERDGEIYFRHKNEEVRA